MAILSRAAQVRVSNTADLTAYLDIVSTAAVQDTAAGANVTVTTVLTAVNGALGAPGLTNADLYFYIDSSSTLIRSFVLSTAPGSTTQTFSFTVDGTSGAAARAGLVRMKVRLRQTTGLATQQYDASSEGNTYGTGANSNGSGNSTSQQNVGYIRGTTTASTVLPGAGTLGYGDSLTATTTLGAVPFDSRTLTVTLAPLSATASAASATATFTTTLGTVDNRFPASSASRTTAVTFPNASLLATPWTTATLTETTRTIDPQLTFTHHLQVNSASVATPPSARAVVRLKFTQVGYIAARVTNANGTGVNGITWSTSVQDAAGLNAALTAAPTSATAGGEAGWGALLKWLPTAPLGAYPKTCTITGPAGATGLGVGSSTTLQLTGRL